MGPKPAHIPSVHVVPTAHTPRQAPAAPGFTNTRGKWSQAQIGSDVTHIRTMRLVYRLRTGLRKSGAADRSLSCTPQLTWEDRAHCTNIRNLDQVLFLPGPDSGDVDLTRAGAGRASGHVHPFKFDSFLGCLGI